jgi:flagellar biogenesis protein FliO
MWDNQKSKAVGQYPPEGGEAMSAYEALTIIFVAMMFIVALVTLMIYISDMFSKRK